MARIATPSLTPEPVVWSEWARARGLEHPGPCGKSTELGRRVLPRIFNFVTIFNFDIDRYKPQVRSVYILPKGQKIEGD